MSVSSAQPAIQSQPTYVVPETRGLPLVGVLPQLLKDPLNFMLQTRQELGDLYRLNLGVTRMVVLNHPRHMQHVFVDHVQNYRKGGGFWEAIRALLGNGLVVSEGSFWLRQRRMMQPQFHRQRLQSLTDLMVGAIQEALDTWPQAASPQETQDQSFNLAAAFNELTMKVVTRTLFGAGLGTAQMEEVSAAMAYVLDYILKAMLINALPSWMPAPGRKKYQQSIAQIDKHVYNMIAAARQQRGPENHLLAMLLDMADETSGEGLTDQQLRDEVITLFLAGYETTSVALSWTFEYLARQPEILEKLQAEVDAVLGERRPEFADLPRLPYTRMVLQETLRLRPPAWQVTRTAVEDDEIDGYPIPAGANLIAMIYMCHHHPEQWPNPEVFDPQRFSAERASERHNLAWMPFGAGQRLCIGRDFALMEGQLALAMVVQRYRITPLSTNPIQPQLAATLRPKGGVPVKITARPACPLN